MTMTKLSQEGKKGTKIIIILYLKFMEKVLNV